MFEDFIRPNLKKPISEARASLYMKIIVVVIGTITMILATTVDKLGGVVQVAPSEFLKYTKIYTIFFF